MLCSSMYKGKENVMIIKLILINKMFTYKYPKKLILNERERERDYNMKSRPGNEQGQKLLFFGFTG